MFYKYKLKMFSITKNLFKHSFIIPNLYNTRYKSSLSKIPEQIRLNTFNSKDEFRKYIKKSIFDDDSITECKPLLLRSCIEKDIKYNIQKGIHKINYVSIDMNDKFKNHENEMIDIILSDLNKYEKMVLSHTRDISFEIVKNEYETMYDVYILY